MSDICGHEKCMFEAGKAGIRNLKVFFPSKRGENGWKKRLAIAFFQTKGRRFFPPPFSFCHERKNT